MSTADTIIFLDTPRLLCLQRLIKRHYVDRGRFRYDLPEGCTDKLNLIRILKVLVFPLRGRKVVLQRMQDYSYKEIVRLRSDEEKKYFLAQQKQKMEDEKNFANTTFVAEESHLALARR